MVKDREAWHTAVHGVARSRTWLSDWTKLNWTNMFTSLQPFSSLTYDITVRNEWWIRGFTQVPNQRRTGFRVPINYSQRMSQDSYSQQTCIFIHSANMNWGTSLVVQRLRPHSLKTKGLGLIPGQGTRTDMMQLRVHMLQQKPKIPCAAAKTWCSQTKINVNIKEGDNRGWDGWMASPTQGTWVCKNSETVKDRQARRAAVRGVTKSRVWLSNWTTPIKTIWIKYPLSVW